MFGAAPPQPTAEELREAEVTAQQTIVGAVSTCFILYMCRSTSMLSFETQNCG
ncbi:hypothetical protein BDY17DRAFT_305991 [Neohortaea acidophila]|uniref:Uncharacterized protein n=1 Tax=Neohortaea acidophila TaxID=245834 RepID=A0A6A6PG31_9PEZI|nr:uncharacterized protein BDY17DRAFT_305991 [Neohortaea acidophila]KAF2478885.1 hypothetical protein BDY17DRAFT_305991 [Neohortaea acidophila]